MDRSIEASGKTVKDAIQKGLAQLGCTLDEVEYSVIDMGSPGFFGVFAKPAKVRMSMKDDHEFDIEMPVFSLDAGEAGGGRKKQKRREAPAEGNQPEKRADKPEKKQPVRAEKKPQEKKPEGQEKKPAQTEKRPQEKKPAQAEKKPQEKRPAQTEKKPQEKKPAQGEKPAANAQPMPKKDNKPRNRREKEQPVTVVAPADPSEPFVPTPEEELSQAAIRARDFLLGLTRRMNVPAEIAVQDGEENLRMVLSGDNMSILIGRRGETLDAIQYLTSLNVNRGRDEYLRVTLDTENYRAKREETLRKLAVSKANQVKKSHRKVVLEPMNPNERRILHSALQNDPDVTTHSEGEEPYRRVIITLK